MPTLYVAGPVIHRHRHELPEVYRAIQDTAESYGWSVELPERDENIDGFPPERFVKYVAERINEAAAVVAVLPLGDQSVPIESSMAAFSRKPQLVVAEGARSPRLIEGLPGVGRVVALEDPQGVAEGLVKLLENAEAVEPPPTAPAY
jgi:hypothetical protein